MNIRIILLACIVISLTACRANPPRQHTESADTPDSTSDIERNVVTQTTPAPQTGSGSYLEGDGPGADIPANVQHTPDAVPRNEPLHRYANRPYTVLGKNYTPLTSTGSYKKRGVASWYGKKFHGQKTSIGEIYDMYGMSAASTTLPIPSYARVTNLQNNKSVIVRVNDRGPFLHERIIDLSYTAATKIGIIGNGQGLVEVESLSANDYSAAPISPIYREPVQVKPLSSEAPAVSGKVYLQLGAFSSQSGAEEFLRTMRVKLSDTGKQLSLSHKNGMVRVHIGPYSNADSARAIALNLQSRLGFKPVVSFH